MLLFPREISILELQNLMGRCLEQPAWLSCWPSFADEAGPDDPQWTLRLGIFQFLEKMLEKSSSSFIFKPSSLLAAYGVPRILIKLPTSVGSGMDRQSS